VLDDDEYRDQRGQLNDERAAAQAAVQRAREHLAGVEEADGLKDAEEVLLRLLADVKAAAAGGLEQAPDLAALRTLLNDMFERVELIRAPGERVELIRAPGFGVGGPAARDATLGPVVGAGSDEDRLWLFPWVRGAFVAGLVPIDGEVAPGHFVVDAQVIRQAALPVESLSPTSRSPRSP
jgi:hypothetical protein